MATVCKIYKISWDEVMQMSIRLARRLWGKRIFGIPRGGQVVATIMSYHGCNLVDDLDQADCFIDDIADTGRTLRVFGKATAVLVVCNGCYPIPDHWIVMVSTKDYVLFPWESARESIEQNTKQRKVSE